MAADFTIGGTKVQAPPLAPGLYVVATPIGHLADISLRALATLAAADRILAEDTRVTRVLTTHYGIATPLWAYHDHNEAVEVPRLLARLAAGERLALVSDAGTPLVSDPGQRLVEAAIAAGLPVFAIPGASAVLAALVVAGFSAENFFFAGFLPAKQGERRRAIRALEAVPGALVFYEAPHRIAESLADLAAMLGDRPAAVARELTKKFEEIRRGPLGGLAAHYANSGQPKGEVVIIVGAPGAPGAITDDAIDAALGRALESHSPRDAAAIVAAELGLARRRVYARALTLGGKADDDGHA